MKKGSFGLLACVGVGLPAALGVNLAASGQSQVPSPAQADEVAALQAEVERLRSIMPGQAFAMTQVAYNFNNLWFAVKADNWPLAQFYFNETRVRLRWAMRITPTRKISSGDVALSPILEAFEKTELAAVEQSIMGKDARHFEAAYRSALDGCAGCHAASEKPYLRLQVPAAPAEALIDFRARDGALE